MPDVNQLADMSDTEYAALTAEAEQRLYTSYAQAGALSLFRPKIYAWNGWVDVDGGYAEYKTFNNPLPTRQYYSHIPAPGTLRRFIWARNNSGIARALLIRPGLSALSHLALPLAGWTTVKIGPIILYAGSHEIGLRFDVAQDVQLRVTAEHVSDYPVQALGADIPYAIV